MYHYHRCVKCRTIWGHNDSARRFDRSKAHACPKCGLTEFRRYTPSVGELEALKAAPESRP